MKLRILILFDLIACNMLEKKEVKFLDGNKRTMMVCPKTGDFFPIQKIGKYTCTPQAYRVGKTMCDRKVDSWKFTPSLPPLPFDTHAEPRVYHGRIQLRIVKGQTLGMMRAKMDVYEPIKNKWVLTGRDVEL